MSASVEREVKLVASDDFELPTMDDVVPGFTGGAPTQLDLDATYYDTRTLALARAGVTLRYRTGETGPPWTVKLPDRAKGVSLTRLEVRFDGDPDVVPAAARDLVRAHLRSRRLRPVARLHTHRVRVSVLDGSGEPAAELVDDLVTGYRDDHPTTVFREVEFESTGGNGWRRLQRAAVQRLTAAGCTTEVPRPKVMRILGERAGEPADVVVPPLDTDATLFEAIRHSLASSVDRLIRHDPGVRLGDDPEDVHQFRVAARTLRSNLKTFGPVLEPEWAGVLRTELSEVGSAAGSIRDLDVLGLRLRQRVDALDEEDARGVALLFDILAEQRQQARKTALTALRSHRYDSLIDALVAGSSTPRLVDTTSADAPARDFLRHAARKQVKRLDRVGARVADPPSDADLHLVRIQAKRTRYIIEAARPVIGRRAVEHAAALAALQDVLGDFNDSTVAVRWLRTAGSSRVSCGIAAGQLIAAERAEQVALRGRVHDVWLTARAKHLRRWL